MVIKSQRCFHTVVTSEVNVPVTSQAGVETVSTDQLSIAIEKQFHWLKHCEQYLNEELTKGIHLSWTAYHASVTENQRVVVIVLREGWHTSQDETRDVCD